MAEHPFALIPAFVGIFNRKEARRVLTQANQARDRKDWEMAIKSYRQYLDLRPKSFGIWVQLGHALKESGQLVPALAAYNSALSLDARNGDLLLSLGHLHKLMGHRDLAIAFYIRSAEIEDNIDARAELNRIIAQSTADSNL